MPDALDDCFGISSSPVGIRSEDVTSIVPMADLRPELKLWHMNRERTPEILDVFVRGLRQAKPLTYKLVLCNIERDKGNKLYREKKYEEATKRYISAARVILGDAPEFPALPDAMRLDRYEKISWQEQMDLVACCNNLAMCAIKMEMTYQRQAIEWSLEAAALYQNQTFSTPLFCWKDQKFSIEEYYTNQQKFHLRLSQSFLGIGNTGCAVHHALAAVCVCASITPGALPTMCSKLNNEANLMRVAQYRHPDINLPNRLEIKCPNLQVRGSWRKCILKKTKAIPAPRLGFGCFVWKGGLYICGGQAAMQTRYRDLWVLPLDTMGPWRRLPDIPSQASGGPANFATTGLPVKIYNDEMILFFGRKTLWGFNLKTETWRRIKTTMKGGGGQNKKWPYHKNDNSEHCVEIFQDKMFVFGGQDGRSQLGHNIFMILDLKTWQWEHVSGTSIPKATHDEPMLRVHAESWVIPELNKFFIMYGNANRMAESLHAPPGEHGAERDYTYEDIWAYDITKKKWTREFIRGNYPCPRTEFSAVYSPAMDKVVAFGGYCATTNTYFPDRKTNFTFAYFADTFIQDLKTRAWSQVLTSGFPTYRAQARLVVDPDSGRTFLVGGYTNSDFVPSKHLISRAFNDVWELRVDVPGGGVEAGWDWEEDKRLAVMGPWSTCFNCGSVGQWKMCGGTCGGKALYCTRDCGEESWPEHQEKHGCRNIKKNRPPRGSTAGESELGR